MAWFQKKTVGAVKNQKPPILPHGARGLKISALLSEDVVFFSENQDKGAILRTLTAAVCRKAGDGDGQAVLAKILEREQGISTTLDTGLSLPHARVDGAAGIFAGIAVLKKPIPDSRQGDHPIRAVFLFFSPNKQEAFPLHLQLLRGVASLFQPKFIDRLVAASDAAEVLELIRDAEA